MKKNRILISILLVLSMLVSTALPVAAAGIEPYTISNEALLARVDKVVKGGEITYTSLYNISSIPKSDLQDAANQARNKGGKVFFYFDTLIDDRVTARVVVNPFLVKESAGDLSMIVDTTDAVTAPVRDKFEKTLGRKVAVMRCSQPGEFGMTVVLSAKLDLSGMDTENLVAYTYDVENNQYLKIPNANCTVDDTGFVYLQTNHANYIFITEDA